MKAKLLILPVLLLVGTIFLSACGSSAQAAPKPTAVPASPVQSAGIVAEGRAEPIRHTQLALNANGLVGDVLVKEGDSVEAGQVVARVENSEAKTLDSAQADALQQLTAANQAVRDAQFKMDNFDVPTEFAGMDPTAAVTMTLGQLNQARDRFEPYKNLSDKRLQGTQSEIDTGIYRDTARLYKKQLDDAWAKYRKAIQWLELDAALDAAKTQLAQAEGNNSALQDPKFAENTAGVRAALANAELRAPFSGTVTNLDLKVGEYASSGQPVVTVADLSSWVIKTTDLTEIDVVNIKEGQPVSVTMDAIPGVTLRGYVLSVGKNYTEKQGDIVYEVTVLLTDKNPAMRWGMTAEVKFEQ